MSKTGLRPFIQEKESLVDRVTDAVRDLIVAGKLRPAEPLSISDLAGDLGISHSPVREALQRLASQGLVELRPARSAIVAPLCVDDLGEIYRVRKLLEVDTAARACPRLLPEDIAVLEAELQSLNQGIANDEEFWARHDAFHIALMRPVLSPHIERLIQQEWHSAERYIRLAYADADVFADRSPAERHRPLVEAARTGKESAMRKALLEHLKGNEREITERLREILTR